MKQRIRRLFSLALCLVLLLGLLPVSAHAADYDMFITNVRVSDENKDDILGDGVFRFDGDRTLTVRGSCTAEDLPIIASAIPDLIIRVAGNSVLRSGEAPAIVADADLSIVGPGTLELGSVESCGIYLYGCGGEIRDISLRASGTWGIAGERPDDEHEYLRICNADVAAAGPKGAVYDFGGGITLTDCHLEDGSVGASAIEDAEQKTAAAVSIRHTGADLPVLHTVTFHNARGANPPTQYVADGAPAKEPAGLSAEDYTFTGWYADAACREPYDFSAPVKSDLELYSGWEYVPSPIVLGRLQAAISAAEQVDADQYTSETAGALASALAAAKAALDADDQSAVDAAAAALEAAMDALIEKPAPVDRSFLEQAVSEARAVETGRYTEESASVLEQALADALAALDADRQSVVDAAELTLRRALAALVERIVARLNLFADVAEGSYCHDSVLWAYYTEPQITKGMDETHFAPDEACTRAQVVTFLWRAKGCPAPKTAVPPFADVTGGYYEKAVAWAVETGITKGTDETHFAPDQPCTRGQIVTFLYRAMGEQ